MIYNSDKAQRIVKFDFISSSSSCVFALESQLTAFVKQQSVQFILILGIQNLQKPVVFILFLALPGHHRSDFLYRLVAGTQNSEESPTNGMIQKPASYTCVDRVRMTPKADSSSDVVGSAIGARSRKSDDDRTRTRISNSCNQLV